MDAQLRALITDVFGTDLTDVGEDVDFRDLDGWDSLTHMTLITTMEDEWEIEFTGDEIAEMTSLATIRTTLGRKLPS